MTIPDERWLPIPGYEGAYEVSDLGHVRSLERTIHTADGRSWRIPGGPIKTVTVNSGHTKFAVTGGVQVKTHRAVLMAFVGPCPPNMEALHRNGHAWDNRLVNLRWGTSSENSYDLVRHGNHNHARVTHCPRGHQLVEPNLVPCALRQGRRDCLACSRAQSRSWYRRKQGLSVSSFQTESDRQHRLIVAAQTRAS